MRGKWVLIILGILVVFAIVSIAGNAKTIYVGPSEKYTSIQSAIDNATDGDTIIVRDGIYYENIKVTKERLTIKSENGSDNCIIDGKGKTVIIVKADGVTIKGFSIRNVTSECGVGIKVNSDYNTISHNKISKIYCKCWGAGIELTFSDHNSIVYNNISNNWYEDAIDLYSSNNNIIAYNSISNNSEGIRLVDSKNNIITHNHLSLNSQFAIYMESSNRNEIVYNNISHNDDGVYMEYSCLNSIKRNNFIDNDGFLQATFVLSFLNHWRGNYWDDWNVILPRPIIGMVAIPVVVVYPPYIPFPWINFDWQPAMKPYDI